MMRFMNNILREFHLRKFLTDCFYNARWFDILILIMKYRVKSVANTMAYFVVIAEQNI